MIRYLFASTIFITFVGCLLLTSNCTPSLDPPKPQSGSCDFTTTVAVGGDFMSGYADGGLVYDNQMKCLSMLVTRQTKLISEDYTLCAPNRVGPGLDGFGWNLKPWESWFNTAFHLGYKTDCLGVNSLMPIQDSFPRANASSTINQFQPYTPYNVAVPFLTTPQQFDPSFVNYNPSINSNPFARRILNNSPGNTVMNEAVSRSATFFMAWLGMEDIFNYAQLGGTGAGITSTSTFSMYLDSVLMRLTANGAKGVIANIPDFRSFPFYTLVPWNGATLQQSTADSLTDIYLTGGMPHINFHAGANGFVIADVNAPMGFRQMHQGEYILLDVPLDSMKCEFYGVLVHEINNRYVLDSTEVGNIDAAIASYNSIIAQKAAQYDLALVDMNTYFNHLVSGIKWDGVDYNAEFVSGGFLSLDGYHPNQKGYALIANEFIKAINSKYGATIPTLNCFDCNGILFP